MVVVVLSGAIYGSDDSIPVYFIAVVGVDSRCEALNEALIGHVAGHEKTFESLSIMLDGERCKNLLAQRKLYLSIYYASLISLNVVMKI